MIQLESFDEVLYYLQNNEILYLLEKGKPTFFVQIDNDRFRVNSEAYNYFINLQQIKELFYEQNFFLYMRKQDDAFVSEEKDLEYYSWKHK